MADFARITCCISANAPGLHLSVRLDDRIFFEGDPYGGHDLVISFENDEDVQHRLEFELMGKTKHHTKIDGSGNILEDITASISDLAFDEIKLGNAFIEKAVYQHDYNGNGPETKTKFYGTMGCNGKVILEFSTPVYLWLIEHM